MKKMLKIALIFLLFNKNIDVEARDLYKIYYPMNNEFENIAYINCKFIGKFYEEEKLFYLIKKAFNKECFKGIFIENGNLYINFNEKIMQETKGSNQEITKIKVLAYTVFQFNNIKTITFLKEGCFFTMPAGSNIIKYTKDDFYKL